MTPSEHVVTLVAGKNSTLDARFAQAVLVETGGLRLDWLSPDKAVDLFYPTSFDRDFPGRIAALIGSQPIDFIAQPVAERRKKLLVADMESTVIEQEMLDELAAMAGVGPKVADITRRAMNGEIDFVTALQERVGLLKGLPVSFLDAAAQKMTMMPGARALVGTMKKEGAHTLIVSGGFIHFAEPVRRELGFDGVEANDLLIEDGKIAGRVAEPVLDRQLKQILLEAACRAQGITLAESLSVGDGANDVPMLTACNAGQGLGVAFHAKPTVRQAVSHRIDHGDLTVLLFAQGYRTTEFVCV